MVDDYEAATHAALEDILDAVDVDEDIPSVDVHVEEVERSFAIGVEIVYAPDAPLSTVYEEAGHAFQTSCNPPAPVYTRRSSDFFNKVLREGFARFTAHLSDESIPSDYLTMMQRFHRNVGGNSRDAIHHWQSFREEMEKAGTEVGDSYQRVIETLQEQVDRSQGLNEEISSVLRMYEIISSLDDVNDSLPDTLVEALNDEAEQLCDDFAVFDRVYHNAGYDIGGALHTFFKHDRGAARPVIHDVLYASPPYVTDFVQTVHTLQEEGVLDATPHR